MAFHCWGIEPGSEVWRCDRCDEPIAAGDEEHIGAFDYDSTCAGILVAESVIAFCENLPDIDDINNIARAA